MVDEYLFENMEDQNPQKYDEAEMRKNLLKACRLGKLELLTSSL